jgi:CheY-like chemotaxis protein
MKVLIVDDDRKNRKLLCDLLELKNIDCVEARNGTEAIEIATPEIKFCIIDLRLPDISGYEVARHLKEKYPQIPMLAYTASVSQDELDKITTIKLFSGILLKPIQLKDFNEVIEKLL